MNEIKGTWAKEVSANLLLKLQLFKLLVRLHQTESNPVKVNIYYAGPPFRDLIRIFIHP